MYISDKAPNKLNWYIDVYQSAPLYHFPPDRLAEIDTYMTLHREAVRTDRHLPDLKSRASFLA